MSSRKIEMKSFDSPDDTQHYTKAKVETVNIGGYTVMRSTLEPGWKWSRDVKPAAKTDSCQKQHTGIVLSGRIMIHMDDDTEVEYGPSDISSIPPGHDGWVVGTEPLVFIEWTKTAA